MYPSSMIKPQPEDSEDGDRMRGKPYSTVVKDVSLLVKGKILSDCKFSVYLLFKKKEFDEKKLLQYKFSMAKYMIFSF